jgi:hypothetical protein
MKQLYFISIILATLLSPFFYCLGQSVEQKVAFSNYHKYYHPVVSQQKVKDEAILKFRENYSKNAYHFSSLKAAGNWKFLLEQINADGSFKDFTDKQKKDPAVIVDAYNRLWKIAEAYRNGEADDSQIVTENFLKAIVYYGNIEIARPNIWNRFHSSCFAAPTAAVNIYFCLLKEMDKAEEENIANKLLVEASDMLKVIALQAWTQPFRNDATDENVVQIERFRNHVWWVGGNALGYRPLLPVACMYKSVPMIDLLSEVSSRGISLTSQTTYNQSFWTEGFTADGAGWGHGKQCLIWGYPIDGTSGALGILTALKDTPWEKSFTLENKEAMLNYFRGGNWYFYKGFTLPCLDRNSMSYNITSRTIPYMGILNSVLKNWKKDFSATELKELEQLKIEGESKTIKMDNFSPGFYNGTRWFYNNDDLIKKTDYYHLIVNMASIRCDGLESASDFADAYNFYTSDGMTLFQKDGKEYRSVFGGWDVTASPGVTAREGMESLTPVTNWRGYSSKYNFAAAATSGGANSAAGFIFEKMNGSEKDGVNDKSDNIGKNPVLYGVKAYKSYFIIGDYLIALGAGITNLKPEMSGSIRTTIDQTAQNEKVFIIQNGKEKSVPKGVNSFIQNGNPIWVKQKNKFAYTILPEFSKNAKFICESKTTDWGRMNFTNKTKENLPEQVDILRLWIDHGQKPVNDTYGYAVYMGNGNPSNQIPIEVLKNDITIQAVRSSDKNIIGVVFYTNDETLETRDLKLKASAPCAILIEKNNNEYNITVTDAEMNNKLDEIVISFNGKTISFPMLKGKDCGKPITKKCELTF